MKKRLIAIHVVSIILLLAIGFFIGQYALRYIYIVPQSLRPQIIQQQEVDSTVVDKEGFAVLIPTGWREVVPIQGVSATVANVSEEVSDETLKKMNFKTNYSITYDNLQNKTKQDYISNLKNSLKQMMPGILFLTEKNMTINGNDGYAIEAQVAQRGADISVLIVLVKGKNQDMWTIAFNTGKSNWNTYKEGFYQIAQSFTVK